MLLSKKNFYLHGLIFGRNAKAQEAGVHYDAGPVSTKPTDNYGEVSTAAAAPCFKKFPLAGPRKIIQYQRKLFN